MKKLEISITKAQLVSFSVQLKEGKPEVAASIALLTDGGKPITTYDISTYSWQEENKFELPIEAFAPMVELAKVLERVVVKHCRDGQKALAAKAPEPAKELTKVKDVVIEAISDEPIDIDSIPF